MSLQRSRYQLLHREMDKQVLTIVWKGKPLTDPPVVSDKPLWVFESVLISHARFTPFALIHQILNLWHYTMMGGRKRLFYHVFSLLHHEPQLALLLPTLAFLLLLFFYLYFKIF